MPNLASVIDVGVRVKVPELFKLLIQGTSPSQHNQTPIGNVKKLIEMNEIIRIIEVSLDNWSQN